MYGRFPNPRAGEWRPRSSFANLFELDEFGPSADIERFREMKAGLKK
jgi:hypothetical protein